MRGSCTAAVELGLRAHWVRRERGTAGGFEHEALEGGAGHGDGHGGAGGRRGWCRDGHRGRIGVGAVTWGGTTGGAR
jgi:hypothetical protein